MKIRIMGTKTELDIAKKYYQELEKTEDVKSLTVSQYYANRGSITVFRLYIEIEYKYYKEKTLLTN